MSENPTYIAGPSKFETDWEKDRIADAKKNNRTVINEEDKLQDAWYKTAKDMTLEKLPEFIHTIVNTYQHDYGTICHAITAAALGTAHAINHSPQGGITGFQASAVMWQFIKLWTGDTDVPLRLSNFSDMLYPQYKHKFTTISKGTWKYLQNEAKKHLLESHGTSNVRDHWQSIVDGTVPFGYTVSDD